MSNKKQLSEEIKSVKDIRTLVETYQEIAAIRMQRVKSSVLKNREFLDELSEVYNHVKYSYEHEIKAIVKSKTKHNKGIKKISSSDTVLAKNGKRVAVLLSSNTGLYGDIIRKTFQYFVEYVSKNDVDLVIIGKVGQQLFKDLGTQKEFTPYIISDSSVLAEDLVDITLNLLAYDDIKVFHGKFSTVLTQIPSKSSIPGDMVRAEDTSMVDIRYIFEPSLEEVLVFFETEILATIFEQTVHESNLSKFASRMISLDAAVVSIGNQVNKLKFQEQMAKHREFNKKQLGSISGISLWGNK